LIINQIIAESNQLNIFLGNPLVKLSSKKEVIKQLFSGQISDIILSFLLVLVDRKRISLVDSILVKYLELVSLTEAIVVAKITTPIILTEEQENNLIKKLKNITESKTVKLDINIDSELIAGFKIQLGSKVIDASLRSQLQEMAVFLEV